MSTVLTADLVHARRRGEELHLVKLDAEGRARALEVADRVIATFEGLVGGTREELEAALKAIDVPARDWRLKDGLVKLAMDRSELDAGEHGDPVSLRQSLFHRAAQVRRELPLAAKFSREEVLAEVARAHDLAPEALEQALFSDLRQAHELRAFAPVTAAALVDAWTSAQAQAVLLRAVRVTVDVKRASPGAARALFRKLKFLRLLFTIHREGEGWRVVIDGPFSLFDASTKYGLQLALALPSLDACDAWSLSADVRWGKERMPLTFRLAGGAGHAAPEPAMPDEVDALVRSFRALESPWRVSPCAQVLDLPGVGLVVPDLVFTRDGRKVFLEVLGYWSRDAVWRRVELVQAGLPHAILFAVGARLRVSEEALGDELPAALYVYKGTMNARAILQRLDGLAARPAPAGSD